VNLKLLPRKGVLPYEHLTHLDVLSETDLPPCYAFAKLLSGSEISKADYANEQNVCTTFRCRTMRDSLVLYQMTDVCLLADVFQTFRANSKEAYDWDQGTL